MTFDFKKDRAALIVVDMQRGFLDEGAAMEVPPGRGVIPNIRRLIDFRTHREQAEPLHERG